MERCCLRRFLGNIELELGTGESGHCDGKKREGVDQQRPRAFRMLEAAEYEVESQGEVRS